jgi:hypothetical protein
MNSIIFIKNQTMFRKRKFAEDVVEEVATTEVVEESTPDSHDQFITLLVDMGLSAEQSEAVHQMAMDLVDAGGAEEVTKTTTTEVQASRHRRSLGRHDRRSNDAPRSRQQLSTERGPRGERGPRRERGERSEDRRDFSEQRMKRRMFEKMRDLRKENEELKAKLGQVPAAQKLSANPTRGAQAPVAQPGVNGVKSRAFEMMHNLLNQ